MLQSYVYSTNINGLHSNRDELAIAATKFDVVACAETKGPTTRDDFVGNSYNL